MNTLFLGSNLTDDQLCAIIATVRDHNAAHAFAAKLRIGEDFEESVSGEPYIEGPAENYPALDGVYYAVARICER